MDVQIISQETQPTVVAHWYNEPVPPAHRPEGPVGWPRGCKDASHGECHQDDDYEHDDHEGHEQRHIDEHPDPGHDEISNSVHQTTSDLGLVN